MIVSALTPLVIMFYHIRQGINGGRTETGAAAVTSTALVLEPMHAPLRRPGHLGSSTTFAESYLSDAACGAQKCGHDHEGLACPARYFPRPNWWVQ